MRHLILLWLSLLLYTLLSYILLLRDEWAIRTISTFYPQVQVTLEGARNWTLNHYLNTIPTFLYAGTVTAAFFSYWHLISSSWVKKQSSTTILLTSLILQGTLFFSYPILSTDIFDYILLNRTAFTYNRNPWTTSAIAFPDDPFINLGSWQRNPSVYGPTYHALAIVPAVLGGNDLIRQVASWKLLMVVMGLITLGLLQRILKGESKAQLLALVALNPLFLIETAGNAHNDIMMVAFMVGSYTALAKRRYLTSGMLVALGTLVKLFAFVLLPLYFILLRNQRRRKEALLLTLTTITTLVGGIWFMGTHSAVAYKKTIDWVFTLRLNSLPNLLNGFPNWTFTLPFLIFALTKANRIKTLAQLVVTYTLLTLIYLLFVVPLYWAWYPIWYLPFLALQERTKLISSALTLTFTSQFHYTLLWLSHRLGYQNPIWTLAIYATLVAPPVFVWIRNSHAQKV